MAKKTVPVKTRSIYQDFFSKHKDLIIWMRRDGGSVVIEIKTQGPEEKIKSNNGQGERTVKKWCRDEIVIPADQVNAENINQFLEEATFNIYKKLHPDHDL